MTRTHCSERANASLSAFFAKCAARDGILRSECNGCITLTVTPTEQWYASVTVMRWTSAASTCRRQTRSAFWSVTRSVLPRIRTPLLRSLSVRVAWRIRNNAGFRRAASRANCLKSIYRGLCKVPSSNRSHHPRTHSLAVSFTALFSSPIACSGGSATITPTGNSQFGQAQAKATSTDSLGDEVA